MLLLTNRFEMSRVVNISEHCAEGEELLDQFIREAEDTDLPGLLGFCLLEEIRENIEETPYKELFWGGIYVVDGKKRRHYGINRVLIHYAYAAYVYRGGMVDTPFSFVQKASQDSIPVPIQELRNIHDENRKLAYKFWTMTYDYLCNNKELYECFDDCDCPNNCDGCGDANCKGCKGKKPFNARGFRLKVISK